MRVKRLDLVTRTPVYAEIPDGGLVTVGLSLATYLRLVSWASMGRTIDNAINAACDAGNDIAADELTDLHSALCECHTACRNHWAAHAEEGS